MRKPGNRGETLMETLCAVLILALLLVALSSVVMATAQISRTAQEAQEAFSMDRSGGALPDVRARVRWTYHGSTQAVPMEVQLYRDGDYYFYESA